MNKTLCVLKGRYVLLLSILISQVSLATTASFVLTGIYTRQSAAKISCYEAGTTARGDGLSNVTAAVTPAIAVAAVMVGVGFLLHAILKS